MKFFVPSTIIVSCTDAIKEIKKKYGILRGIEKSLKKKKYNGGRQAQHMMAAGVAMTPNISINAAETMIVVLVRVFSYNTALTQKKRKFQIVHRGAQPSKIILLIWLLVVSTAV